MFATDELVEVGNGDESLFRRTYKKDKVKKNSHITKKNAVRAREACFVCDLVTKERGYCLEPIL